MDHPRRRFLAASGVAALGSLAIVPVPLRCEEKSQREEHAEQEISATEDLMREHGVLNRILLVYEEGLRRLRHQDDVSPDAFHKPARLVRTFVEDYHEKLEENFIFPEFEKKRTLVELVQVLRRQHQAGRALTDRILRSSTADAFGKPDTRQVLVQSCEAFIRMYRPHETREDTVLFPTLHKILTAQHIGELGEQFEEQEERLFGEEGFAKTVDDVAQIERQLGIYDLSQFTPDVKTGK